MAVRREEVQLHVTSNLAREAAKDAAAARLLAKALDDLGRSGVDVDRITQRLSRSGGGFSGLERSARQTQSTVGQVDDSINNLTGRLRVLADAAVTLGPALIPITTGALGGLAGLANQLGFAAAAGGTAMLAFQGVGDAVTALNEAAREPTAENLLAAETALQRLSPAARDFARQISDMRDEWAGLRDAAATGFFPGLTEALDGADVVFGRAESTLESLGRAAGDMLADGIDSLGSDRWADFFTFLETEAKPTMADLGVITGSFTHGLAELWMAFQPLNSGFSTGLAEMAVSFDAWATGLEATEGFGKFLDYVSKTGPQVLDTFGALGNALIDVGTAAAPFGGPVLAGIEAFAKVVSAIADSPLGPTLLAGAAAMAIFNRAMTVGSRVATAGLFTTTRANAAQLNTAVRQTAASVRSATPTLGQFGTAAYRMGQQTKYASDQTLAARTAVRGFLGSAGRVAAPMAGLALATSDMGKEMTFANTATFGLIGAMGGLPGAVGGAALGAVMDLAAANNDLEEAMTRASRVIRSGTLDEQEAEYRRMGRVVEEQTGTWRGAWTDVSASLSKAFGQATGGFIGNAKANTVSDLARGWDDLGRSIRRTRDPMSGLAGLLTGPFNESEGAIRSAAASMRDFANSAGRLGRILSGEAALIDYEQAIDDLAASLRENGNSFDYNTEKGRANARALLDASARAIEFSKTLKGFERVEFLRGVRSDLKGLVGEIPGAGRLFGRVDRELRRLGGRWAKPRVTAEGARQAERDIRGVERDIRRLGGRSANPRANLNDNPFLAVWGITGRRLGTLDGRTANPRANLNNNPFLNVWGITSRRVSDLDRRTANPKANLDDNASGPIAGIQGGLNALRDKTITVTVRSMRVNGTATANAAGGLYPAVLGPRQQAMAYSTGGMRSARDVANAHVAQIASAGPTRVWAEPETGGESYIPHRNDWRRPRAKDILEQTAGIMGGSVEWYARGGVRPASVVVRDQLTHLRHKGPSAEADVAARQREYWSRERDAILAAQRSNEGGGRSYSGPTSVRIDGPLRVKGTLHSNLGPVEIEGIAEAAVDERMLDWQRDPFDAIHGRGR